jgi:hypothetical protein
MVKMTGEEGVYNITSNTYDPPAKYDTWEELIKQNNIEITRK